MKYRIFGSGVRFLIRESLEPKLKNRTFRSVDSPGNNLVNPMLRRCRESAKFNIFGLIIAFDNDLGFFLLVWSFFDFIA